jgi:general secretion pathway protein I
MPAEMCMISRSHTSMPAGLSASVSAPANAPVARRSRAFTLLEVLVALTVFALAVVVLGSAYLNVLNSYEAVSRGVQVGEDFAFARTLVLNEPDREKLEQGGQFDTAAGLRAAWNVQIESTNIADLFTVIFTCEIADPARTEPERMVQTFRLLRPTWSNDPAERSQLKEDAKARIFEMQGKDKPR